IYGRGKLSLENVFPHSRGGRVEKNFGKITLGTRDKDFNPDLPVIGILAQHESDALDYVATKEDAREPAPKTTKGRPKKKPRLSPESSSSNDSDYSQQDSDKELVLSTTSDEESNIQIPDSTRTPETCYSPGDFLVVGRTPMEAMEVQVQVMVLKLVPFRMPSQNLWDIMVSPKPIPIIPFTTHMLLCLLILQAFRNSIFVNCRPLLSNTLTLKELAQEGIGCNEVDWIELAQEGIGCNEVDWIELAQEGIGCNEVDWIELAQEGIGCNEVDWIELAQEGIGCNEVDWIELAQEGIGCNEVDWIELAQEGIGCNEVDWIELAQEGIGCNEVDWIELAQEGIGCNEVDWIELAQEGIGCNEVDWIELAQEGIGCNEVDWIELAQEGIGCNEVDWIELAQEGIGCNEVDWIELAQEGIGYYVPSVLSNKVDYKSAYSSYGNGNFGTSSSSGNNGGLGFNTYTPEYRFGGFGPGFFRSPEAFGGNSGSYSNPNVNEGFFKTPGNDENVGAFATANITPQGGHGTVGVLPGLATRFSSDEGGNTPPNGNSFGVFTSSSSGSSDVNGKKTSYKTATSAINDNGKITVYTANDPNHV
ncbi:unnamed protein product, partial [Timema podura]|nr:unnamed protein product [Timema podura]